MRGEAFGTVAGMKSPSCRVLRSTPVPLACALALLLSACGDDAQSGGATPEGGGGNGASGGGGSGGANTGGEGGAPVVDPIAEAVRNHDWQELDGAPSVGGGAKQDDVFFLDPARGFLASGPTGAIHATTDGGATWDSVLSADGAFFRSVLFTSDLHGFAGNLGSGLAPSIDDDTLIYETLDGGESWSPVTTVTGSAAKGLCNFTAVDEDTLFGIGRANGPAHLLATTDGGASWVAKDLSEHFTMAVDGHFFSANEGLVVGMSASGQRCNVMKTTDGGDTFSEVFRSERAGLCWKVHFPSDTVGYLAIMNLQGGAGTFAKTTDGGDTWTELPAPGDEFSGLSVGFLTEEIGWMSGEDSYPVYRTFDGGLTWEEDPVLQAPINRFRFVDGSTAFAAGASVWKLELGELP